MGLLPLIRVPGLLLQFLMPLAIVGVGAYLFVRRYRERDRNAPLRGQIEAQVCFETPLDRVSKLGTGGFEGTRGYWIPLRGPKRLIVGTGAFMISAPQALCEYVFTGGEASIAVSQAPSPRHVRDWIVITGQSDGRQVQLAVTHDSLPDVWQALAGTGATLLSSEPPAPDVSGHVVCTWFGIVWCSCSGRAWR